MENEPLPTREISRPERRLPGAAIVAEPRAARGEEDMLRVRHDPLSRSRTRPTDALELMRQRQSMNLAMELATGDARSVFLFTLSKMVGRGMLKTGVQHPTLIHIE